LVSPTTGLIERTPSMSGCASSHSTMASAARQTHSVQVSRIGVSSSPSSRTCVTPMSLPKPLPTTIAAGTRSRNGLPPCGRIAVTPVLTRVAFADRGLADAHAGHVGDGVVRAGVEDTADDARADAGASRCARGRHARQGGG
jgi:hypothetical protein